ncbi:Mono(2-hydroxyethyl) terephthalate hydrolase [Calothrix sp. NIES-4071]|nr:Mono(2-hydroxyethyl) terephthalate hydrolase [Calothrix sp. NIES-4071]BAZ60258.1 Mono(2-hydroxyethyl) terephthalate hydrolase [Calothrix sp. NIES-4105]
MSSQKQQTSFWNGFRATLVIIIAFVLSVLLLNISGRSSSTVEAQVPMPQKESNVCSALIQKDFTAISNAPTAIFSATVVPATAQTPEYCDVKGYVTPQVQFELQLPTQNWNRRYLQVGCGGYCGSLRASPESTAALNQNFAVAFDNSGHVGGGIGAASALWGLDQPQLRMDFGYRSEHVTALAAKAIATAFYGNSPNYSYFQGCSNGGRQALMEAQRYPNDFNGIIAGAPAAIQAPLNGEYETWNARANLDAQGNPILPSDKLALIHQAAIANCDGKDGLVDEQITDPRVCTFKPESLRCSGNSNAATCLTTAEIGVVNKIYGGAVERQGRLLYPGSQTIGSELGWAGSSIGRDGMAPFAAEISNSYLKYLAFPKSPPASFSYKDWQFTAEGFDRLRPLGKVYNATNPNLKAFRDRGGKLLLYHGWADPAIPPQGTLAYYQAVQNTMGGFAQVQSFARLFMLPGVYHCQGGTGPSRVDYLTPIVTWVEQSKAPTQLIATQTTADGKSGGFSNPTERATGSNAKIVRTRPIFPYPMQARYSGKGSIDDAANFVGVAPSQTPNDSINWIGNDLFKPR